MAERRGKIITYNPTNRQGTIRPEDNGPPALFYINNVANPEPEPKAKDTVVFDAPEPRKNKRGKVVQDQAISVTIEERAPELTAEQLAAREKKKKREKEELRRTFLDARKNGGIKKPERKGRRSDKGKGKGKGRSERDRGRDKDKDRDKPRRPRKPRADAKTAGDPSKRKPLKKKVKPKQKRPSIQSKIRYPMARDIPRNILHMELSNPGLIFDKFIQWPAPPQSPKPPKKAAESKKPVDSKEPVEKKEASETTESAVTQEPAETTVLAEAPEAIETKDKKVEQKETEKKELQNWKLSGKHKQFFLTRTVAGLYRNFERKTLPWSAVRARREVMLRSLEHSGYTVASDIIKGPWRYAVSNTLPSILDDAPLSFQRMFSYPIIPAGNLQSLLLRYLEQCDLSQVGLSEEVIESFRKSIDRERPAVIVFDAVPTNKIVQFTIERSWCSTPQWQGDGSLQEAQQRGGRRLYTICTGDDAGFSLSVAAKEPAGQREISPAVLAVLTKLVRQTNQELITPGNKEEKKFPGAVMF